jgi:Spy/CpxP family protein refolding chaperone
MIITTRNLRSMALSAIIAVPFATFVLADEVRTLRPEIEQLNETVAERIEAAADKLGLSQEQRDKIKEIRASRSQECKDLRAQRRALLQEELQAISSILTPEQRDKAKELAEDRAERREDRREQADSSDRSALPKFVAARATLAERLEAAADKLGLTSEQRKQVATATAGHAEKHADLNHKVRECCEEEFKAVAAILTPEQREKAHAVVESRVLRAAAASSIADRLEALGDKLGLSNEQRGQIVKSRAQFAGQYRALHSDRRELLGEELKAISAILTPEQRDKVKDFAEDRIVVLEVRTAARDTAEDEGALRETIADRLESMADRLGLTPEQRTKIRGVRDSMAGKFKAQRERRSALRGEEMNSLKGILTPAQREQVKDLVDERKQD